MLFLLLCSIQPASGSPPQVNPPAPAGLVITEILYDVPGSADPSGDGSRDANGDEFVELVNFSGAPINLIGHTLMDNSGEREGGLVFTFPDFSLPPGGVVVVFNGRKQSWSGPVGDSGNPPQGANEHFASAFVFTMDVSADRVGFNNESDFVLLKGPDGGAVSCVGWGKARPPAWVPPDVVEEAPLVADASVQRPGPGRAMARHPEQEGVPFSPGRFPLEPGTSPGQVASAPETAGEP